MAPRRRVASRPPNPTWADLKQLGWALLLIYAVIAVLVLLSRAYFGAWTALEVGLGLAALVTAALALITAVSLAASFGADAIRRWRGRSR